MFRLFLVSICVAGALVAQDPQPGADVTIDAAEPSELTDNVRMALSQAYVFPETATKMEQAVREHQRH